MLQNTRNPFWVECIISVVSVVVKQVITGDKQYDCD